jgi:hypothetical protein
LRGLAWPCVALRGLAWPCVALRGLACPRMAFSGLVWPLVSVFRLFWLFGARDFKFSLEVRSDLQNSVFGCRGNFL